MSSFREPLRSARSAHLKTRYPGDLAADMQPYLPRDLGTNAKANSIRIDDTQYARPKSYWFALVGSMAGSAIAACLLTAFFLHQKDASLPVQQPAVAMNRKAETPVDAPVAIASNDATISYSSDPTSDANESTSIVPSYEPMVVPAWSVVPSAEALDSVKVTTPTTQPSSSEKSST